MPSSSLPHRHRKKQRRQRRRTRLFALIFLLAVLAVGGLVFLILRLLPESVTYVESPLQISEYLLKNSQFPDSGGAFSPWVELHNTGSAPFSLSGWSLTVGRSKTAIPSAELAAGGYLRISVTALSDDGGDTLRLRNEKREVAVETVTQALPQDRAAICREDGSFAVTETPSPGFANDEAGVKAYWASRRRDNNGLVINEVMAANSFTVADKDGRYSDYIELCNVGKKTLSLKNYGLSKEEHVPFRFRLPNRSLKPGEVLLIFADGSKATENDEIHAPFKLSKDGESLFLTTPDGYTVDSVTTGAMAKNEAYLRDEAGHYALSEAISPGFPNTQDGIAAFEKTQTDPAPDESDLIISEVMTRNTRYAPLNGKYGDWVELYNPTDQAVSLKGYSLSDEPSGENACTLPDVTVKAGAYVLIHAVEEETKSEDTPARLGNGSAIRVNFKLNGRCYVGLFKDGKRLDSLRIPRLPQNVTKGRLPGKKGIFYFETPTPGKANQGGADTVTATPAFSQKAGAYNGVSALTVSLSSDGTVHYTTDGSKPTLQSPVYSTPLTLSQTTVIRAIAKKDGAVISDVSTASYILNENHKVDVVSLTADPDDLYSESRGIYATGSHASSAFPYSGANFWKDWEREANVELLTDKEGEAGFNVGCGIKIFGAYSRAYAKKSFKLCFRDSYGTGKLHYKVFENRDFSSFDKLVLRAGGQDSHRSVMKDELTTGLADDAGILDTQAYRPVVLYVNGEYFGMYYIREKINAAFIADHYGVSESSVDLIQGSGNNARAGSADAYLEMIAYMKSHDLRNDAYYEHVTTLMDVQNYADYVIAEIYCGNSDQGNIRFFRSTEYDGKFRWILFDTDLGFQSELKQSVWEYINPAGNGQGDMFSTAVFNNLIKNKKFRDLFVDRLAYNLNHVYNAETVLSKIDSLYEVWKDEGARSHKRWGWSANWASCVDGLRYFARHRREQLKKEFTTDSRVVKVFHLTAEEQARCFGS